MYRNIRAAARSTRMSQNAVAVAMFTNANRLPRGYMELDKSCAGALSASLRRPEFSAASGAWTCLYPNIGPTRLYVLGLGPAERFGHGEPLRIAAANLIRAAHLSNLKRVGLCLSAGLGDVIDPPLAGQAVGEGLAIANFEFARFKGQAVEAKDDQRKRPSGDLSVVIDPDMRHGLTRGLKIGASVNLARTLAATPPNVANPAYLVAYCRRMAREVGLKCTVINAKQAARLKMGGLLAVGAAGSTPPALICLEHGYKRKSTKGRGSRTAGPIMLVGKAITFDTGGYSLKSSGSMDGMKYDKCGGTAVIGAMHGLARLGVPQHVIGLIPTAENMVDQKSYRPGDILRMVNGVNVEVTNTDAEGRLVLADALAFGCRTYKPRAIVDLATLTGGVVVALGTACAGLFCQHDKWRRHLIEAGESTGEQMWHLPLWDQHQTLLKSTHADIVNSGSREAHPIQGAAFLSHFVDDKIPWAHLDIAGVSDLKSPNDLFGKGPTGFGVRLIVQALETWKQESQDS